MKNNLSFTDILFDFLCSAQAKFCTSPSTYHLITHVVVTDVMKWIAITATADNGTIE
jgi:hypothetical protein